jgi:hypothetical protein
MTEPVPEEQATQRVTQYALLLAGAAETMARIRTQRQAEQAAAADREAAALRAQRETDHAAARVRWSRLHDPRWRKTADTGEVFAAWCAAAPWAGTDPDAAAALRLAEQRLRKEHPDAMRRYDTRVAHGWDRVAAMRDAAALFDTATGSRDRAWTQRPAPDRYAITAHIHPPSHSRTTTRTDAAQVAADGYPQAFTADAAVQAAARRHPHRPRQHGPADAPRRTR